MKQEFLKTHWIEILVVLILLVGSILLWYPFLVIMEVIFVANLILIYTQYDYDEMVANRWWNELEKDTKVRIHKKSDVVYSTSQDVIDVSETR